MGFPLPSLPPLHAPEESVPEVLEPAEPQFVMQRVVAAECLRMLRRSTETAIAERWAGESRDSSAAS